jgi:LmbE family N-acetylglucosaminyl deacetylase
VKITVVSAHRGDAAFGVGLAVRVWLEQGHAVEVVNCFTRSEFAPFSDAGSVHANDRMSFVSATRKREDEAWVKLYRGKLTLTDLNMKDAPLRLHCEADQVFQRTIDLAEKSAVKIQKAVERSAAGAMVVPLALDGHVDRMIAREAGMAAWAGAVAFYEDLPQSAGFGDEALDAAAHAVRLDLRAGFAGPAVEDVEAAVARKRRIAWCYDSQIDESVTGEIAEFCRGYGGRERLWVNPAWMGDPAFRSG